MLRITCYALAVALLTACANQTSESSVWQRFRFTLPNQADKENGFASEVRGKIRAQLSYADIDALPAMAEVRVSVSVALDGRVTQTKLSRSSGYPAYDQAVLNAVAQASPLPAPMTASEREFTITFRPRDGASTSTIPPLLPAHQQTTELQIPQVLEAGRLEKGHKVQCNTPAPVYPAEAQRAHQQGTATVRVYLAPNGTPEKSVLEKSSGYPALDQAALNASAQMLCSATDKALTLVEPFQFSLNKPNEAGDYGRQLLDRIRNYLVFDQVKTLPDTAETRVFVVLAPDGQVMQTKLAQSSGDPSYDAAILQAVEKASPLPVRTQPEHRRFTLTFRPKDTAVSSTHPVVLPEQ